VLLLHIETHSFLALACPVFLTGADVVDQRVDRSTQEAANRKKSGDPGRRQSRKKVTTRIPTITTAATAMSLKNKPVRNGSSPGSFERRKRDKTGKEQQQQ
jgi:hypothetical protein